MKKVSVVMYLTGVEYERKIFIMSRGDNSVIEELIGDEKKATLSHLPKKK